MPDRYGQAQCAVLGPREPAFEHMARPPDVNDISFDAFELNGVERPRFGHEHDDLAR